MNPHLIKKLFPNASASTLAANAMDHGGGNPDIDNTRRARQAIEMPAHKKVSDDDLLASYAVTRSIWESGKALGICGQSVHERLVKLGVDMKKKWSADELQALRASYAKTPSLAAAAAATGRSTAAVACKAEELGLSARRGTHARTPDQVAALSARQKAHIALNGHPRGMLGKTHSDATKAVISAAGIGRIPSPESVDRAMRTRLERYGSVAPRGGRGSWKSGWREIGGKRLYARSRWEANYARYLEFLKRNGQLSEWEHEPETFWFEAIRRGCRSYLPDFRVTLPSGTIEYHECKGWMDPRSLTKLKRMKKYHPLIVLVLRDAKWFKANNRRGAGFIEGWES